MPFVMYEKGGGSKSKKTPVFSLMKLFHFFTLMHSAESHPNKRYYVRV